jgi:hypothetical protein
MFMLTLPKGEQAGDCRINGHDAEYQLFAGYILWRYKDETPQKWERRNILIADEVEDDNGVECISYSCDDGEGSGDRPPYIFLRPTEDGVIEIRTKGGEG